MIPILNVVGETEEQNELGVIQKFYKVTISSEPIRVNDWQFIASIDITNDPNVGRIINRVPGVLEDTSIPAKYRTTNNYCEHCNVQRHRNSVFVLYNSNLNEWKQVGRNCLADFLGGIDPEEYVKSMELVINFINNCEGAQNFDYFGLNHYGSIMDLRATLVFSNFVISKFGWVSRSKAREKNMNGEICDATADIVQNTLLTPPAYWSPPIKELMQEWDDTENKEKFEQNVEEAIEWIRSTNDETNSDYMHNLYVVCKNDSFDRKHIGIACSLIPAYLSTKERVEKHTKENANLTHVGIVGNKENLLLTVKKFMYWGNNYGVTTAVFFEDPNGNKVLWKASKDPELQEGETYEIKATVKEHAFYNQKPQTIITRAKVSSQK